MFSLDPVFHHIDIYFNLKVNPRGRTIAGIGFTCCQNVSHALAYIYSSGYRSWLIWLKLYTAAQLFRQGLFLRVD